MNNRTGNRRRHGRKLLLEVFYKKGVLKKFHKIQMKTPEPESLFVQEHPRTAPFAESACIATDVLYSPLFSVHCTLLVKNKVSQPKIR